MTEGKTFYVIYKCGYEGIEEVTDPTTDPREALTNIIKRRKVVKDAKSKFKEVVDKAGTQAVDPEDIDDFDDAWDEMMKEKKITFEEWQEGKFGNPDQWCLRKWDGEKFECCCNEFGVKTEKTWLF